MPLSLSQVLVPIAVASIAAALLMMQMRVLLQFVTISIVMLTTWLTAGQQ
jgi:hypothetical protein